MYPINIHRILFTFGFFWSVYLSAQDIRVGLVVYCMVYWAWMTSLSYTSMRYPYRGKINVKTLKNMRGLSIFCLAASVLLFFTIFTFPFRMIIGALGVYYFAGIIIPMMFFLSVFIFIIELYEKTELQIIENNALNKVLALIIMPYGLWTIYLKRRERGRSITSFR